MKKNNKKIRYAFILSATKIMTSDDFNNTGYFAPREGLWDEDEWICKQIKLKVFSGDHFALSNLMKSGSIKKFNNIQAFYFSEFGKVAYAINIESPPYCKILFGFKHKDIQKIIPEFVYQERHFRLWVVENLTFLVLKSENIIWRFPKYMGVICLKILLTTELQ